MLNNTNRSSASPGDPNGCRRTTDLSQTFDDMECSRPSADDNNPGSCILHATGEKLGLTGEVSLERVRRICGYVDLSVSNMSLEGVEGGRGRGVLYSRHH